MVLVFFQKPEWNSFVNKHLLTQNHKVIMTSQLFHFNYGNPHLFSSHHITASVREVTPSFL